MIQKKMKQILFERFSFKTTITCNIIQMEHFILRDKPDFALSQFSIINVEYGFYQDEME